MSSASARRVPTVPATSAIPAGPTAPAAQGKGSNRKAAMQMTLCVPPVLRAISPMPHPPQLGASPGAGARRGRFRRQTAHGQRTSFVRPSRCPMRPGRATCWCCSRLLPSCWGHCFSCGIDVANVLGSGNRICPRSPPRTKRSALLSPPKRPCWGSRRACKRRTAVSPSRSRSDQEAVGMRGQLHSRAARPPASLHPMPGSHGDAVSCQGPPWLLQSPVLETDSPKGRLAGQKLSSKNPGRSRHLDPGTSCTKLSSWKDPGHPLAGALGGSSAARGLGCPSWGPIRMTAVCKDGQASEPAWAYSCPKGLCVVASQM